ncbi:hypothetical protein [Stygiolobus caldivivus]|uniref:Uncharacterized protein n=1 Tax=Stygiolobus caldivivus TaxID=2824673 RepID=A0A8D5U747_9CREN|nr:hypothetical protein [Stygiolobus caldivivus]BCU70222.1 hypothetical protein KN1_15190 [Stygiolobus caldivivus]
MNEQDAVKIAKVILEIVKYNLPVDCEEDIEILSKKLLSDLRDLGLVKTLEKWLREEDEDLGFTVSP